MTIQETPKAGIYKVVRRLDINGNPVEIGLREGLGGPGSTFDAEKTPVCHEMRGGPIHHGKAVLKMVQGMRV